MSHVDLDDTTNCPLWVLCGQCGATMWTARLAVATYETSIGVFCRTMCDRCVATSGPRYGMALTEVAYLVMDHCEHLGIDLDQMAAALEAEQSE
jgi:hypothetical protein